MSVTSKPPSDIAVNSLTSDRGVIRTLFTDTLVANHIVTSNPDVSDVSVVPSAGVTVNNNNSKILNSSLVCISVNVSFSNSVYYPGPGVPPAFGPTLPLLTISDPTYWPLTQQVGFSFLDYAPMGVTPTVLQVDTNGQITIRRVSPGPGAAPNLPNLLMIVYNL